MAVERTLAILKPDSIRKNVYGDVFKRIVEAGFEVKAIKMTRLTMDTAGGFYAVHRDKPFYDNLREFMSSGPCIPMVLEKENAVEDFRKLIGATNPEEADEGTIRKDYADNIEQNIVHGSDSVENGNKESAYFFGEMEIVANNS